MRRVLERMIASLVSLYFMLSNSLLVLRPAASDDTFKTFVPLSYSLKRPLMFIYQVSHQNQALGVKNKIYVI